ncbi:MAG TPA: VCBS repeat-containing protein, partial [Chitinophagales bacterium]|nr:VCBS repeat-containing protein [Chitinophagales bacterium]
MFFAEISSAQTFSPVTANLPHVRDGAAAWGDYDNDGDLDVLITGIQDNQVAVSRLFQNNGSGGFMEINAGLTPVFFSAVAWGDYNNDGWLDILLTGRNASASPVSKVYRNNGGNTFSEIDAGLTPVEKSSVDWGDYDNDGDLDILLAGAANSTTNISVIYENDSFDFKLFDPGLPGISEGTAAWGDYDNDGDYDVLLTGSGIAKVFRNDGAIFFTDVNAALAGGVVSSSSAWADYDSDGDLDILITGSYFADVYRNDGSNVFNSIGLPVSKGVARSSVAWGDYDNDGDLDFTITGDDNSLNRVASLFRNDGGNTFTDVPVGFTGLWYSASACGDFNNDGRLDVLMSGEDALFQAKTILYENTSADSNAIPSAPTNLNATELPHRSVLSWNMATDAETPASGLTYNVYVGVAGNLSEFVSAMSEIPSGYRR